MVIYDGWDRSRFLDVAAIVVGPILATFAWHVVAGARVERVRLGRSLTRHDRLTLTRRESGYLLLGIPPVALLALLRAFGVLYSNAIQVIIFCGIASLTLVLQAILQSGTDAFQP